jgi:hypothetical protein
MGPLALDLQLMMGAAAEGVPLAGELAGPARPQLRGDIAGPGGVAPDAQDDRAIEQGQQAQLGGLLAEVELVAARRGSGQLVGGKSGVHLVSGDGGLDLDGSGLVSAHHHHDHPFWLAAGREPAARSLLHDLEVTRDDDIIGGFRAASGRSLPGNLPRLRVSLRGRSERLPHPIRCTRSLCTFPGSPAVPRRRPAHGCRELVGMRYWGYPWRGGSDRLGLLHTVFT